MGNATSPAPTWRILDPPDPEPKWTGTIMFTCPHCHKEALLPVIGLVIAQTSEGALIFDPGKRQIPKTIQCRFCRKRFEGEGDGVR
jgi:hypothetical protein